MSAAQPSNGVARIRTAWIVWAIATFTVVVYTNMAQIAGHATITTLQLNPSSVVEVRPFRLFDDTLQFGPIFSGIEREQRPELGCCASYGKNDGLLKYQPGAEVQVLVSMPSSQPLRYEAMPLQGVYRRDQNIRWMTANLSIEPGVYRWPPLPSIPVTHLHVGFNSVRFEVTSVGEQIAGETVSLFVDPPLGSKIARASVAWLWFGLWWPVLLGAQVLWAICLCPGGLRRRKAPT